MPQSVPVKAVAVARRDVPVTLKAIGTIVPYQAVAVKSRIDSQIMEVKFHDGDTVRKGDPLFILDDRVLKSQMAEAEANLAKDKAQLENLKRQYARTDELAKQGYATGANRDDAKAALDVQQAVIGADKAAIDNIKVQLDYTVISAPIDGRTGTINVTVGNNVKANDTAALVTINQIRPIFAQASLPQNTFDAMRKALAGGGVSVLARTDQGKMPITGKIQYINNAIDQASGTYVTRAVFENETEALWPGMLVNLTLTLSQDKNVLTIPEVAVQHGGNGDYVFIVGNGKAIRKTVAIERVQDGTAVVSSGLSNADQVVIDGQMSLKDGSAVTVQ